ncbi:hypothetical protein [Geitlerinema sp. PCC 9228]|uniref:hypothetical protein n=1 Tax=Geitlerinema sp. PCC 9228 TaxID=111611 RepID=UPI0011147640|nr:hypothetical protein [Geitlerinema sp. PCC 9228]
MDFDPQLSFSQPTASSQPGAMVSGIVGNLIDGGDDFLFQPSTGGQLIVDPAGVDAFQLGLVPGEAINLRAMEWEGNEIDTNFITRADGSPVLGNPAVTPTPTVPPATPQTPATPMPGEAAIDPITGEMMATVTGTVVAQTEPDSFLFQSDGGMMLVDASPEGDMPVPVTPGETVTMVGEMDDEDFDAYRITRPDGSLVVNNPIEEDYGYEYEDDWDDWYEYPVAESYGSISGTIQAVAGNEFLLNSENGPVFVDGGPSWYQPLNLLAGEQVTVSGEYDDEDFDAFRITRSNGEVISIRDEAGPPPWAGAWK